MNIAYFGSPTIAADLLHELMSDQAVKEKISLIVTQPDRPAGKRLEMQETEVKILGKKNNLKIFDKDIKHSAEELKSILKKNDIELCIVFAYGGYIPGSILNIPSYGFINVHPSLLPHYRGPSPTAYPILLGQSESGTSIIKLNEELDGGDIISQEKINIEKDETRQMLENKLTKLSFKLIIKYIHKLENKEPVRAIPQDRTFVSYTRLLNKLDGFIELETLKKALQNEQISDLEIPPIIRQFKDKYPSEDIKLSLNGGKMVYNLYRGLYGWPGIWTRVQTPAGERRLKLIEVEYLNSNFKIKRVQLEGKNEVDFPTFNAAYSVFK